MDESSHSLRNAYFIDASVWIARFRQDDFHHQRARAIFNNEIPRGTRLVTSNLVIYEVLTVLAMRAGKKQAQIFGEWFFGKRELGEVTCTYVDELLEPIVWQLFHRTEKKDISFTDCASVVIAEAQAARTIVTFDKDFQKFKGEFRLQILN